MKGSYRFLLIALAAGLALTAASCGGGGEIGGDRLPIYGVPGGGGDKFDELNPPIVKPPAETFRDNSSVADTPAERWLKNCYYPLPPVDGSTGVYQNASIQTWADMIFSGVNANRAAEGRAPLVRNAYLDGIAQAHARDMALRDFFGHINPEQMASFERLLAINPARFDHLGENSAKGQETPQEVSEGWYHSEKHYKISMDPIYSHAGVGVFCDVTDATMPMHIIMVFVEFVDDPAAHTGWLEP